MIFLIPFYFILNNLKNKNKNYYLLSFFFGFIKEHFFIFPIIIGIFYYFKEKKLQWIILSILSALCFIFIYYLIYNNFSFTFNEQSNESLEYKNNLLYQLLFFFLIFTHIF